MSVRPTKRIGNITGCIHNQAEHVQFAKMLMNVFASNEFDINTMHCAPPKTKSGQQNLASSKKKNNQNHRKR
jgi:hypothetical protein